MKKYIVEFTEPGGKVYEFEFLTSDIEKSIEEYSRNRIILASRVINEGNRNNKQMLFG